jgi:CRP-like cAMP-binding protein
MRNKKEIHVNTITAGEYFGEVALIKNCLRTATVKSLNYSTWAELKKSAFERICMTYSFIKSSMEQKMKLHYKDKWKMFLMKVIRNIDFINKTISDDIVEEIMYRVTLKQFNKGAYLFKQGKPWNEIHILVNGEVEIYVNNNEVYDILVDTLFWGWSIGAYSSLMNEDYTVSGLVKEDWIVILISKDLIDNLRTQFDDLDKTINEYETYIQENGLPYLDYKIYRSKFYRFSPLLKFQNGIRRIIRIVHSYKINDLQGFLISHQKKLQEEKAKNADRRNGVSNLDKNASLSGFRPSGVEIKQMESIELKINLMMDYIVKQSNQMDKMQKELKILRNSTTNVELESSKKKKKTPM